MEIKEKSGKNRAYDLFVGGARSVIGILILICFALLCVFLAKKAYSIGYQTMAYTPVSEAPGQRVMVRISEDMSASDIGELFEDNGLIDESQAAFLLQERFSEYHGKEVPGTYILYTSMTVDEMLKTISAPESEN